MLSRLAQKDTEGELSQQALYENGITLVVAGSETTATLLTGLTYFLCRNPDKLKKVQDEVRSAFSSDDEITPKTVNDLTYILAVLSEGLRIFPPTAFGIPRLIANKAGQEVAGSYVPHKVMVFSVHACHRSLIITCRLASPSSTKPHTVPRRTSLDPTTLFPSDGLMTQLRNSGTTAEMHCSRLWLGHVDA